MAKCDACGKHENMPYKCRRCGGTYCGEHRLPESHDCPGLNEWNDPSGVFDSGFDDSVDNQGRSSGGVASRVGLDTGTGGPLGYFRGNMTYVFLGLMWLTLAAQYLVAPLLGINAPTPEGPGDPLWYTLFTLNSANPLYVWTWVTSVFSHGGLFHIAGNSLALYFFGPPVERYIGSKKFAALFLVSGIIAGLSQVGTMFALGTVGGVVLGASGAVMAIMGVLTVLNPNLRVMLIFPPIPMPIWVLTGGYALLSVIGGLGPVSGGIAHFAHLSGLLIGLGYGKYVKGRRRAPQQLGSGGGFGRRGPGGPGGRF
ncbi:MULTISPECIES: rhomboid family intramembrane serine protease [Halorussus]|uniref:rhomboid family intramembrane serine protease n=1 Tax=Halorussus TaxID=1070314 RepID=UPI0020A02100|nr:rhomboid family intramembrane serine protease [Halorussus vallis]USZ75388.1 rhomboid family intramembrane serine protease [Halorussus vallis]